MKLTLDNPKLNDVRTLLETGYQSILPDESTLAQAWADPYLSTLLQGEAPAIGRLFAENAIQATRLVLGKNGIQTGIPQELIGSFVQAIANASALQGAERWVAIAEGASDAIIDIAMEAAGEIPVVGWGCKIALGIAKLAEALSKQKKPRPPLLQYTRETDEFYASEALKILGGLEPSYNPPDWTPIFMPPGGDYFDIEKAQGGFFARREGQSGTPGGLGCLPPGLFGSRTIQVDNGSEGLKRFGEGKAMPPWYAEHVNDSFTQLPGLTRISQATWAAASTNNNVAIYNLRYNSIENAWADYTEQGLAEAAAWIKQGRDAGPKKRPGQGANVPWFQGDAIKYGLEHANYVQGHLVKTGRTDNGSRTAKYVAEKWCSFFNARAYDMLMTQACAYASQRQGWFQNAPGYVEQLEKARRLLLQHPDVKRINPSDCPDRNFRWAVTEAGGGTGKALETGQLIKLGGKTPQRVAAPPGTGLGFASSSGSGGGPIVIGAAAVAAAVGLAWMLRK